MDSYTLEEVMGGAGFFVSGEWTLVWQDKDGVYYTTARNEYIRGACVVGGGRLRRDGTLKLEWCD